MNKRQTSHQDILYISWDLAIAYPDLGHVFSPSNEWMSSFGPVEQYVLKDMYEWPVSLEREVNEEVR